MFIEIISKEGELSWINLKQVLVIKLGRPTEGWLWDSLTAMRLFGQRLLTQKKKPINGWKMHWVMPKFQAALN